MTTLPSETWRRLAQDAAPPTKMPKGLDALWYRAQGYIEAKRRTTRIYLREARSIVAAQPQYQDLTDEQLKTALGELQACFRRCRDDRSDLQRAFALVREASLRTMGFRPHPVQIAAALCICDGSIGEMATGEGKTLAASVAAVVSGWSGRGCHLVTFNDYLAARDAEEMRPLYEYCGLTVGHVDQEMQTADRRQAYRADVTYATSQSVAADYLRDRLLLEDRTRPAAAILESIIGGEGSGAGGLLLRGLETAIIDEADSILIDEAVTPLIISGQAPNTGQVEAYQTAAMIASGLRQDRDYKIDDRTNAITLTSAGKGTIELRTHMRGGLWAVRRRAEELVCQALVAREFFLRDRQYVIREGKIVIVDESTGRLMPDRTWRAGLHQAVEAKEGLEVNPPKETMARISFQRFFRMYRRLGGTTGTAWEARRELWQIFGLATVLIPTHRPSKRRVERDRIFRGDAAKWRAVEKEIVKIHEQGRPILVGTRSVEQSELLSESLSKLGLQHEVLNAVRHEMEAAIVSKGGIRGAITVATNMAGRGTDIKLGEDVRELGGLHVIATERHESARIDRQLFGRSARQGDPGSAVSFVCTSDEICQRFGAWWIRLLVRVVPGAWVGRALRRSAQLRAEKHGTRQRQAVQQGDDWLDRFLGFAGTER